MKKDNYYFIALQWISYVSFGLCMSNIIPYMAQLGYDSFKRGIVLSSCAIFNMILQIILGILSDKLNTSKWIVFLSTMLYGISAILIFYVGEKGFILVWLLMTICVGCLNTLCGLQDIWIIGLGKAFQNTLSLTKAFGSIGWATGSLLSAYLLNLKGYPLLALVVLGLLFVTLYLIWQLPDIQQKQQTAQKITLSEIIQLFKIKEYTSLVLILFILYGLVVANTGIVVDKMLFLQATSFDISLKWAMGAILEVPMYLFIMKLIHNFGNYQLLTFSSLVLTVQFLGFFLAVTSQQMIYLCLLQVFTTPIILITSKFIIMQLVPDALKNSSQLIAMSIYIGASSFIVPFISGYLGHQIGYNATLFLYTSISLIILCILLFFRNKIVDTQIERTR